MTGTGLVEPNGFLLVVVDVQEKLAAAMDRRDEVAAACARLIRCAGLMHAPIIVTRQYPAGLGDTIAPVLAALEEAARETEVRVVDKSAFCACHEPRFMDALEAVRRPQVVIAGMETHICVTQTALALHAAGAQVHVAADACCSRRHPDHSVALHRLRAAGVVVTVSESAMYEAVGEAGTETFKRLLSIVKGA